MGWMATIWTPRPVCKPDRIIFSWGLKQIAHKYSLSDSLTAQTMREIEREGEGEREREGGRERGRGANGERPREREPGNRERERAGSRME